MPVLGAFFLLLAQAAAPVGERLDDLVRIALEQNREIRAAERRWEAATARPSQARALPNPTVSFGYWNAGSPLPGTSVGEDPLSFIQPMVMQRVPFPGKRGLRAEIAHREADREGRLYDAVRLGVAGEVKRAYFDSRRIDVARSASVLDLARKEHLPDFDVRVGRMFMGAFDDMWEVSISADIPLFFWRKERRGVEEAATRVREPRNEYEATGQALFREVTDNYLAAQTAERLERLYREAVIPQASLALESSLTAYRVGDLDFLGILDNWSTLLDFEVEYHAQVAEHEKALANLEELTGLRLVGSGEAQ